MVVIHAQKIPHKELDPEDILATFCFHFQQYSYLDAKRMPFKRILQMLKIAEKERAKVMYDLTQIASAPHTKKGSGVKKLLDHFKKIMDK